MTAAETHSSPSPSSSSSAPAPAPEAEAVAELARLLAAPGASPSAPEVRAALDRIGQSLLRRGAHRQWLDLLLLAARVELGLPAVTDGPLSELPEPVRTQYEDRYVEALKRVGQALLDEGRVVAAWPYFRLVGETEPVRRALEAYVPPEPESEPESESGSDGEPGAGSVPESEAAASPSSPAPPGEDLHAIIEVAFNQGAHPRRGFELILEHYGTCSAITAFESLPPDLAVREACAERLVRTLHEHLVRNLRSAVEMVEGAAPPADASVLEIVRDRPAMFHDEMYHIDISHLASTVRLAPMITDPDALRLAVDLAEYGARLSERLRYPGDPPFEDLHADHRVYLRGLLGEDPEAALAHFRAKLPPPDPDGRGPSDFAATLPAQALARLLLRLGRLDEAIELTAERLWGVPEAALFVPPLAAQCRRAGRLDRLAEIARDKGDPVLQAAALLERAAAEKPANATATANPNPNPNPNAAADAPP